MYSEEALVIFGKEFVIFLLRKMAVALYGNENVIGVVGQRQ